MPRAIIAVALAYVLSPLDLIPDFIPVLGLVDDLIIVPALIWLALRLVPPTVMDAARHRADTEPLRLSKNLCVAAAFLLLWLGCFEAAAAVLVDRWPLARAHRLPTYAVASALFTAFALGAVLSESDEARAAVHGSCSACRSRWCSCDWWRRWRGQAVLAEPLLPT